METNPYLNIAVWEILLGVMVVLLMFFVLLRKSRAGNLHSLSKALLVTTLFIGVGGVGYFSLLPHQVYRIVVMPPVPDSAGGKDFPVTMLPSTGSEPALKTFPQSLESLFASPLDGLITIFFLTAIAFIVFKIIRPDRRRILKDLKEAKIAAQNVLEDLQEEKRRLALVNAKDEALLESIGEGVVATDHYGNIILMNKVAELLLGYSSKEILGKSYAEALILEDMQGNTVASTEGPMIKALAASKTIIETYNFLRKNGTKIPVVVTATPVILDAKPTGAIIVFRDITKEREIEKLRVDFLSLASHQLRTPLSGTKWLIETIQRGVIGELTQKQKEYINNIYQVNERMIRLVTDMLNVLMLEGGVAVMKKEEVPVAKLCEDLTLFMEPASKSKGVTLTNAFKNKKTFSLQSDFQVLRSILESFVSNAINYSPGGRQVVLDATEESGAVVFSVKDTGIGIPTEEQKRIFERFYRASNAKGYKPDGTGLGLYIAFMLAQKIEGKITFESEEGVGTTFYLRVPKKLEDSAPDTHTQTKTKP